MKSVEARSTDRWPDADTERKNPKHGPVELRVIAQAEIATVKNAIRSISAPIPSPQAIAPRNGAIPSAPLIRIAMPIIGKTKKAIAT